MEEREQAGIYLSKIKYSGKCLQNTMHTPATAEVAASEFVGCDLLQNAEGGYPDEDQSSFCDEIVGEGDTKGRNKTIRSHVDIIRSASEGKPEGFPSIEHVIKCVSNEFYIYSTLKGIGLLYPAQIKAITNGMSCKF